MGLLPVYVDVLSILKLLVAGVTEAQKITRWIINRVCGDWTGLDVDSVETLAEIAQILGVSLQNAVAEDVSGLGVGTVRDHTRVVLRELDLTGRERPDEIFP